MALPMAIDHILVGGAVGGAQGVVAGPQEEGGAQEEDGVEVAREEAVDPVHEPLQVWYSFCKSTW